MHVGNKINGNKIIDKGGVGSIIEEEKLSTSDRLNVDKFLILNRGVFLVAVPQDPVILLSFINTKLRDFYPSLEELGKDLDVDTNEIVEKLKMINYEYDEKQNRFV